MTCFSHRFGSAPEPSSVSQHPGSPRRPQQLDRARILVRLLAISRRILRPSGMGAFRFANADLGFGNPPLLRFRLGRPVPDSSYSSGWICTTRPAAPSRQSRARAARQAHTATTSRPSNWNAGMCTCSPKPAPITPIRTRSGTSLLHAPQYSRCPGLLESPARPCSVRAGCAASP